MRIKITADSTCDLPQELIEKNNIHIFPLYVVMDGKSLRDGVDIVAQDIFDHVQSGGKLGNTAAVNVGDYLDKFKEFRSEYDAIIHFTISQSMSACFQNANIAASCLDHVYVVDSANLSTGIALLVLDACDMAASGMDAKEICNALTAKREKLDVSFVIDTLEYLKAGGRCSPLAALGANLLNLKPCIEVKGGSMDVGKKYRGAIEKVIMKYLQERLAEPDSIEHHRAFITNSGGFPDEFIDSVMEYVRSILPFDELYHSVAGCTISNHCGPKTLGILMYRK